MISNELYLYLAHLLDWLCKIKTTDRVNGELSVFWYYGPVNIGIAALLIYLVNLNELFSDWLFVIKYLDCVGFVSPITWRWRCWLVVICKAGFWYDKLLNM